jgi:hypothetical protein
MDPMMLFRSPRWIPIIVGKLCLPQNESFETSQFRALTTDRTLRLLLGLSAVVTQLPLELESISFSFEKFPISRWRCAAGTLNMYIMFFQEEPKAGTVVFGGRAAKRSSIDELRELQVDAACRLERAVADSVWIEHLEWLNGKPDCSACNSSGISTNKTFGE